MTEKVQEERRRRTKRRAKRGLVAGYIHELSARHRESPRIEDRRNAPASRRRWDDDRALRAHSRAA